MVNISSTREGNRTNNTICNRIRARALICARSLDEASGNVPGIVPRRWKMDRVGLRSMRTNPVTIRGCTRRIDSIASCVGSSSNEPPRFRSHSVRCRRELVNMTPYTLLLWECVLVTGVFEEIFFLHLARVHFPASASRRAG